VDPLKPLIMPLAEAATDEKMIGGKAANQARLQKAGYRIPDGFCITSLAYRQLINANDLDQKIRFELGRKSFAAMRWEEIWDAALRIRSAFLNTSIPPDFLKALRSAHQSLGASKPLAVRSSAPGEDSSQRSFAGLHESVVNISGEESLLNAVRVVWASLWSDAALLYRRELGLDPAASMMAVLVQEMVQEDYSGVAFARDPREPEKQSVIIEAVPGLCSGLVDGAVDPDRWVLDPESNKVLAWKPGKRDQPSAGQPILAPEDLQQLLVVLRDVEDLFGWPPDLEWTGRAKALTLLQARPITTRDEKPGDERSWYLTLRPGSKQLNDLCKRVAEELIPRLEVEGGDMAAENLSDYDDQKLADAIEARVQKVRAWKEIYQEEFIPFAHGVRQLGLYYNDAVRPEDPYEFMGLLQGQSMLASRRNEGIVALAGCLKDHPDLRQALTEASKEEIISWETIRRQIDAIPGAEAFIHDFEDLSKSFLDIAFKDERLEDRPDLILKVVIALSDAQVASGNKGTGAGQTEPDMKALENRLLAAVGRDREEEAREVVRVGRISWRLRDDDNLLVGRLVSQLLKAIKTGEERLRSKGRLAVNARTGEKSASLIAQALRQPGGGRVVLPALKETPEKAPVPDSRESPRQILGQPASPGLVTARARLIRGLEDLGRFRAGEILVCDAIQPTMTHLVPLAAGIVERRGGMLIHGAIIARELGIPCVNGVDRAAEVLKNGDLVTVDGYLGIVTVGPPEFELEEA
jgi:pyruvate,water dikinase